jgi:hypothetical protein
VACLPVQLHSLCGTAECILTNAYMHFPTLVPDLLTKLTMTARDCESAAALQDCTLLGCLGALTNLRQLTARLALTPATVAALQPLRALTHLDLMAFYPEQHSRRLHRSPPFPPSACHSHARFGCFMCHRCIA